MLLIYTSEVDRSAWAPIRGCRGHADVQEGAGAVGVARRLKHHVGLVVRRLAADVDDHPAVGELDDRRLAVQAHFAAEDAGVEVA